MKAHGAHAGSTPRADGSPTHYVTYFDRHYLTRGIALLRSLRAHRSDAVIWVICLDDETAEVLAALDLGDIRLEPLRALEQSDPELAATRATRSLLEYYYTLTAPSLLHVLAQQDDIDRLVYLDADTFFLADPEPVFDRYADASMLLLDHRYADEMRDEYKYGRFNVGVLVFHRTEHRLACLRRWRKQCIAWCHDFVDDDKYGDQKYLDEWPDLYDGVAVPSEIGLGLAPWNMANHRFEFREGVLTADGEPVLHFHFSSTRRIARRVYDTGLHRYGAALDAVSREHLYRPYIQALAGAEQLMSATCGITVSSDSVRRKRYERLGRLGSITTALAVTAAARRRNVLLTRPRSTR